MCGASKQQNDIESQQQSFYGTMNKEAQSVFGQNQELYSNLMAAFKPILMAGPDQEGFGPEERTALQTQSTEGVASNYAKAAAAVRTGSAEEGGGNVPVPSGAADQAQGEIASSAAGELSKEQQQITQADYSVGRENWLAADQGLSGAGAAFAPSTALEGEATSGGSAAASTANQIAQENNSWMGALGGLAGTALGGWASGGFKMLGG